MMKRFLLTLLMLSGVAGIANADCTFREDTAAQAFKIGPFLDSTDGVTAETGLTISNTDVRLSKDGGNIGAKNSGGGTHDENGMYTVTFDATDTNTAGNLQIQVFESGAVPVFHECTVMPTEAYDALYGGTILTDIDIGLVRSDTIGTVTSQTEYILDTNVVTDNNWRYNTVVVHDVSTNDTFVSYITSVVSSTDTIVINDTPTFTVVTADRVRVYGNQHAAAAINNAGLATAASLTTVSDRQVGFATLMARSDAAAETDMVTYLNIINADNGSGGGNFSSQTDAVEAITDTHSSGVALASGTITSTTYGSGAITADAIATNAIGAAEIGANAISSAEVADSMWDDFAWLWVRTSIGTLTSQTVFTLTDGSPDDDAYNGCGIFIKDNANDEQRAYAGIQDYVGGTKTVTLDADPGIFTIQDIDFVQIFCLPSTTEFMNKSEVLGVGNSGDKWRGNP